MRIEDKGSLKPESERENKLCVEGTMHEEEKEV